MEVRRISEGPQKLDQNIEKFTVDFYAKRIESIGTIASTTPSSGFVSSVAVNLGGTYRPNPKPCPHYVEMILLLFSFLAHEFGFDLPSVNPFQNSSNDAFRHV